MKKTFTLGIFLAMIMGIGSNAEAATIKSAGTSVAGLDWSNTAAWDGGVVPTYTDDVQIQAGDSITNLLAAASCKSLSVSGKLMIKSNTLYVNGDITVNSGGTFNLDKTVYCKNIKNNGKFYAPGRQNSGTSTYVYLGYDYNGTAATASTDSCTIENNGIFGWYRNLSMASSGSNGCGFILYYSNIAKAVNVTTSPGVTSGYVFSIVSMLPANSGLTPSQNLNVYFNESVAFVYSSSSYPGFSLYNTGETLYGYPRTCTIAKGDTMFVAGRFHSYNASAPTANQSNMTYNVYGCLDFATWNRSRNEIDLYTSSATGNTSSLIVNVGDGTANNPGTLVLGKTINLVKSLAAQTLQINTSQYSTIKFPYTASVSAITATNVSWPFSLDNVNVTNTYGVSLSLTGTLAQTIVGGTIPFAAVTINNTSGNVSLSSPLSITGALTLTAGKLLLGANNLTVGSTSSGSATGYVVTDGTGTLTVPVAAATSTLLPIGASATSYDPVTVNAASASNISAKVSATLSGTANTGIYNNAKEWTLASSAPSATLLTFKPSAEDASVTSTLSSSVYNALIGQATGTATYTNYSAAYASGSYSATFSTFGSFVTGANSLATALKNGSENALSVFAANKSVLVKNAKAGELVTVYGVNGVKVASSVLNSDNATLPLSAGIYMVKVGATTTKVAVF